jgi:hypothetical protein
MSNMNEVPAPFRGKAELHPTRGPILAIDADTVFHDLAASVAAEQVLRYQQDFTIAIISSKFVTPFPVNAMEEMAHYLIGGGISEDVWAFCLPDPRAPADTIFLCEQMPNASVILSGRAVPFNDVFPAPETLLEVLR